MQAKATGSGGVASGLSMQSDDPEELMRQAVDELALEDDASRGELERMSERLGNLRRDDGSASHASDVTSTQRVDDGRAPLSFRCPISHDVMADPVTTADGQSLAVVCCCLHACS